jgi:hypothetical protein
MQDVQRLKGWVWTAIVIAVLVGLVQGAQQGGPIGFVIAGVVVVVFAVAGFASTFVLLDMHRMMREALARGSVTRVSSAGGWQPAGSDQSPRNP